jgi:hypothetical protein
MHATLHELQIPPEVAQFCTANGITGDLRLALQLANEIFAPIDRTRLSLEVDPETDEETVAIDIFVPLDVDEALRRERAYSIRWVTAATPAARGLIRMLCNLS